MSSLPVFMQAKGRLQAFGWVSIFRLLASAIFLYSFYYTGSHLHVEWKARLPATHTRPPMSDSSNKGNIAICLAVKDQGRDLPEFLAHHYYNVGIRHIYIVDDGSEPPISSLDVDGFFPIPSDAYSFHYMPATQHGSNMQLNIYDMCNSQFGSKHDWIAYIDADEFIWTHPSESLADILRPLEDDPEVAGLAINWQMHTSNGLMERPQSARKAFRECIWDDLEHDGELSDNRHVKAIIKPSLYDIAQNPHYFWLLNNSTMVGEDGDDAGMSPFRYPPTRKRVGIHHYAVKSKAEYEEKVDRGNAMDQPKDWVFWHHIAEIPHVPCLEMTLYEM